jgi:predicted component of type VI protein secretion system
LFLIHHGRSYPIRADGLVIGCGREPTELAIGDGSGVPRHAAVIHRNGTYYLKQLESPEGIVYKGMRIDNKRIDEGDVFHIGDHELRFTYRAAG